MSKPPDVDRRRFVGVAAATVAAGPLGLLGRVNAMTHALTDVARPTSSGATDIRPFRFKASDADLADLPQEAPRAFATAVVDVDAD